MSGSEIYKIYDRQKGKLRGEQSLDKNKLMENFRDFWYVVNYDSEFQDIIDSEADETAGVEEVEAIMEERVYGVTAEEYLNQNGFEIREMADQGNLYAIDDMLYTYIGLDKRNIKDDEIHYIYIEAKLHDVGNDIFVILNNGGDSFEILKRLDDDAYQSLTVESIQKLNPVWSELKEVNELI